ncbi:MAG TPA: trypsin-like peptidase domain-containing protein [Clostridia bacterium]|nr:trypsin-like peptidase domain-containing protein [Clostridia bacterium]
MRERHFHSKNNGVSFDEFFHRTRGKPVSPAGEKQSKNSPFLRKFFCAVILAVVLIFIVGFYGADLMRFAEIHWAVGRRALAGTSSGGSSLVLNKKPTGKDIRMATEEVAKKICPSVVGIIQYKEGKIGESGEGSGIIMNSGGYIITNYHVIEDASRLMVVDWNKKEYSAKVVGSDSRTDLAVVKISGAGFTYAQFGNSDQCQVGEQVVAVGNPSGLKLAGSVTQGIISALNRNVDVGNGPMNLIQTDAAINPGNSGGALVNMYGQVIGINSAKISHEGYEGIGFSIPVNTAKPVIDSILKYGYVKGRVKFGFDCREIDQVTADLNQVPEGIYIDYVEKNSGAQKSGVKADDIVTAIDGVKIKSSETLITERDKHKPGDVITLGIYRRKLQKYLTIPVKLMEDRGDAAAQETFETAGW